MGILNFAICISSVIYSTIRPFYIILISSQLHAQIPEYLNRVFTYPFSLLLFVFNLIFIFVLYVHDRNFLFPSFSFFLHPSISLSYIQLPFFCIPSLLYMFGVFFCIFWLVAIEILFCSFHCRGRTDSKLVELVVQPHFTYE